MYSKDYLVGTVLSFESSKYIVVIENDTTIVMRHSTVHRSCSFPEEMMVKGHLKVGSRIHLCRIFRTNGIISYLPDHRYYQEGKDDREPVKTDIPAELKKENSAKENKTFYELIASVAKEPAPQSLLTAATSLFAIGLTAQACMILNKYIKNNTQK